MSKSSITILRLVAAMLIAIGLGAGSMGIASAQEGGGLTTVCGRTTEGGGNRADSVDCSGGDNSTSSGIVNQANAGVNRNNQSSNGQSASNAQGTTNGSSAGNGAGVSDIGGDDTTAVTGEGNGTTPLLDDDDLVDDGGIIGALIAILLLILGGGDDEGPGPPI